MEVVHNAFQKETRQQKRKEERDQVKKAGVPLSKPKPGANVKLEASMIIKNEQEMLPRALECMKGIDNITIIDTGSSDKTIDIYKEYQDKGYPLDWYEYSEFNTEPYSLKSFSHARNESKRKCMTGDWLFILDGDEWFDFDIQMIKNMINSEWTDKFDVLSINVKTDQEETTQPRVFRNNDTIWYGDDFHNALRFWQNGLKGQAQLFDPKKFYKTSLKIIAEYSPAHKKEPDRTLKMIQRTLKANPYDTRALYYISREWLQRKEPLKALYYLQTYVEVAQPTNEAAEAYFLISTIYADMQIWHKAAKNALMAVGILPSFKQAWQMIHAISHPSLKHYWEPMLKKADNQNVMFVRDTDINK